MSKVKSQKVPKTSQTMLNYLLALGEQGKYILWQILHRVVATALSFCDRVGEVPLMSVAKAAKTLLRGLPLEAITRILGTIMR